jgi:hypothetical protein
MTLAPEHKGQRCLRQAVVVGGLFACLGASGRWYEFKGLYVNMPLSEVKKAGLKCITGKTNDVCKPTADDRRFATIGGVPVKEIGLLIDQGKVRLIRVETIGAYWDELKEAMSKNYGKPKKEAPLSVLWDRGGAEYITVSVSQGKIEVIFGYSDVDSDKRIKECTEKAAKDF